MLLVIDVGYNKSFKVIYTTWGKRKQKLVYVVGLCMT